MLSDKLCGWQSGNRFSTHMHFEINQMQEWRQITEGAHFEILMDSPTEQKT